MSRASRFVGLAFGLLVSGPAWAGGAVAVDSEPAGGEIWVDGRSTGLTTPATVADLAAGPHEVQVRGPCVAGRAQVAVVEGDTVTLEVPLVAQSGMLELELVPADASVELDGARLPAVSSLPMAVDCGLHSLKVSAQGYQTLLMEVEVAAARTTEQRIVLDEVGTGQLEIDVAPPEATIWLNERRLGEGPQRLQVTAGPHALRAGLAGYAEQERQVLVEKGQVLPVAFSLQPTSRNTTVVVQGAGRKRRPWIGLGVAGLGLAGLSWGTVEYLQGRSGWAEFNDRKTKIEDGLWPDTYADDPAAWAYEVYDTDVKGHRSRMLVGDVVGGVLLGSGLVLAFTL